MLNLIRKDLIIIKSYLIKALAVLILYIFLFNKMDKQGMYMMGIYLIVQVLISVSFYYGERAKEDYILKSIPINKKDVVLAKYASIIVYFIAYLILIYLINFAINILDFDNIIKPIQISTVLLSISVIFISATIQLPIYFKFNYNKGRIVNSIIYILFFSMIFTLYDNNQLINHIRNNNFTNNMFGKIILISPIVSLILFTISSILSITIYEKKESM
ncbi:ABC-2 transporter permease [Clostridium botulinum]|uniref:ABC-2 transporter permease n=2 Tax=Clostridium TaxID=1485 RepID=A0AAU8YVZ8_CLOBO|nr:MULTISPECIES: ABC-2 transporter permease [Clostridium]AVP64292.1 ABC-2 transporter permease [Clostridium botulinum]EJE7233493.1 ABC-2 transporter permease [Clostridium botulinum]MBO0574951.1 ABC-2 transporter permease [Clostridium botulinum]MCF4016859.1 ABC-2 transporter permease [Clostridium sporogenes]HDK7175028.1 ABC-2 transporter permease [Clostridium botulinum]